MLQAKLAKLVQLAEALTDAGETDIAAHMLAFVLAHPATPPTAYEHADLLFDDLEATICPRVIWDARAFAAEATLDDVLARLQAGNHPLPS